MAAIASRLECVLPVRGTVGSSRGESVASECNCSWTPSNTSSLRSRLSCRVVKPTQRNQMSVACTAAVAEGVGVATGEEEGRVFNFAAGPAALPYHILKNAQEDLVNWNGSGMSVMEMSHRGKEFLSIIKKAEADLRELLKIPDNYVVMFLQGGATSVFSSLPLNLCSSEDVTDYVVTGSWSDKAVKEGKKYCKANVAVSGKDSKYTLIPSRETWKLSPGAKYVHICANETIQGVEFKEYPDNLPEGAVLVADMSSNFCSKPVDVSKFGVIYAGAQKNVGPSGVTIIIVRKDLLETPSQSITPVMYDWKIQSENESLYNTPPCFSIYMCGLVFADLLARGGLEGALKRNEDKAGILYEAIDNSSGFYRCPVAHEVRSLMNVPFTIANSELEPVFIKEATAAGLVQLKGHRSVGGMRASIYNAMPKEGVKKLVQFMNNFQAKNQN